MELEHLLKITSNFDDVSPLLLKIKKSKSDQNKLRRRLKTKILKYSFLKNIVDINCSAGRLTKAVKNISRKLAYKT